MDDKPKPVYERVTPEEQKKFDDALKSMLASVDHSKAISAGMTLLRCLPAADCIVEIRSTRYLTDAEWAGVEKHLAILRETQRAQKPHAKPRAERAAGAKRRRP